MTPFERRQLHEALAIHRRSANALVTLAALHEDSRAFVQAELIANQQRIDQALQTMQVPA